MGKTDAKSQREYEIISNEYVVLGIKDFYYICSPIDSINENNNEISIDFSTHKIISSNDIETEIRKYRIVNDSSGKK